jgi:hypothetical protein
MSDDTLDFADRRFEDTRQKILFHLEQALEACAQPREFQVLIGPIVRLQENTLAVRPGVQATANTLPVREQFNMLVALLRRADTWSYLMVIAVLGFGYEKLTRAAEELIRFFRMGSLRLIDTAYAANGAGGVDPTALLVFQLVIAAMVPLLGVGGFCALIFANSPEGRKAGKELLIGVTGFVLGAATRMIS